MRNIVTSRWAAVTAAVTGLIALGLAGAASSGAQPTSQAPPAKPTIVLVHGAWADGSSWAAVTKSLQRKGFTVDVEPNPLRGVASDAQYLKDYLANISGPIVLAAHSYGGMVTTSAATGNPNVTALVYIDAYVPARGDSVLSLTTAKPGSVLAVADPSTVLNTVPVRDASGKIVNADLYVKPALFPAYFAAGVRSAKADLLAAGQRPLQASALSEAATTVPAWKSIPSWDLIGTADRVIPPAEQQFMARRAGAHIVRVKAPHLSMVSDPGAVTKLITLAAADS